MDFILDYVLPIHNSEIPPPEWKLSWIFNFIITGHVWHTIQYSIFGFLYAYAKFINKNRTEQLIKTEREKYVLETSFLRSQFHPHFVFNVINSMYNLARKKTDTLPVVIQKFADLMRHSYEYREATIPIEQEIQHITNYLSIVQFQYNHTLQYDISFAGDKQLKVIPSVLITYVENAVKHGYLLDQNNPLTVAITAESNRLQISISNPVKSSPITSTVEKVSTGIGLKNAQRRLEIHYGNRQTLKTTNQNNYYKVDIHINNPALIDSLIQD
ncbi:sensor histidine kinase [Xanthocytophaga agilis]|uniref:Sensor histidine kinase n=1 Tax=Xanthocytophaga agilis TaxID=3048010 RepID=A0AAE3RCG5_9BACT|nr:sensor histidine kinase [Xanthocytophaga agilis]MDJ1505222.1 sensor histidine kinase [Xanthocytophaga agilis]